MPAPAVPIHPAPTASSATSAFSFIANETGVPAPAAPTSNSNFSFICHHGEPPPATVGSSCFSFVEANRQSPQVPPLQDQLPQQLFDAQCHQAPGQQQEQDQQKLQQQDELARQQRQNEQTQKLDILKGSLDCLYQQPALDIESQARSSRFAALNSMNNQYIGCLQPFCMNQAGLQNQAQQAAANQMSGIVQMAGAQTMCMRLADAATPQHQHQQQMWTAQVAGFGMTR